MLETINQASQFAYHINDKMKMATYRTPDGSFDGQLSAQQAFW